MSLFQEPIGSPLDIPFKFSDLLDIEREFALQPGAAHFGSPNQDVACIPDIQDVWRMTICAPKATGIPWVDPVGGWSTVPYVPPVNPVTTPEPHFGLLLVLALILMILRRR